MERNFYYLMLGNLFPSSSRCFFILLMTSTVYAATKSSGNLNIVMSYELREPTDCIQGNPLLCVYLSKDDAHYFVRLQYNGKESKATIKNPVTGTYKVQYFTAQNGKEKKCENAVKLDAIPDGSLFHEVQPHDGNNLVSLYAGGTLNLNSGSSKIKIAKNGTASLKLVSTDAFDNVIPAYYISVTGTKVKSIKDDFHLYLYESDKNGKQGKLLQDVTRKKNRVGYFRDLVITYPGTYYYLIKEKVSASYLTTDKPVLMEVVVGYVGERLCATKISYTREKKTRKIAISGDKSKVTITVKDPDTKNAEYYIYGYSKKSYPDQKKDGTFDGPVKKMTKSGTAFTVTVNPPTVTNGDWYSYNIVKKVNGEVQRGYTINIPFRWGYVNKNLTTTAWRVRPRVEFASVSSKK